MDRLQSWDNMRGFLTYIDFEEMVEKFNMIAELHYLFHKCMRSSSS